MTPKVQSHSAEMLLIGKCVCCYNLTLVQSEICSIFYRDIEMIFAFLHKNVSNYKKPQVNSGPRRFTSRAQVIYDLLHKYRVRLVSFSLLLD